MNIKQLVFIVVLLSLGTVLGVMLERYLATGPDETARTETALEHALKHQQPGYVCPMHSQILSDAPGSCPICGMDLVAIKKDTSAETDNDDDYPVVSIRSGMINSLGVRVALVERGDLVRKIETPGFVQLLRKEKYSRYTAPAKGRVSRLYFTTGQWHETGDPLVDIDLDDLVLVQEKHLELLAAARQAAPASETLLNKQAVMSPAPSDGASDDMSENNASDTAGEDVGETAETRSDSHDATITLEKTRLLMQAAGMSDEQIKHLEETGETSPTITLYARHPGEVMELRVKQGDVVNARTMLFTLGGLMRATVLANAFQRDASWIHPGQEVDVVLPHNPDKVWKGRVSSGAVSINTNSQNIGIKFEFVAPSRVVKSGMYVVGNIYGRVKKGALMVPAEAVIYSGNEKRVIEALGNGQFRPVPVKTGISNDTDIEILEGLEEGDTIVVSAQFLIDSESSLQASYRRMAPVQ
ncbi:MAG TPA: HlyD family efflux transporter periplasmic adaptor subunit [Gammaproteobacteria bacterium]|nr:HlyD family efflux transporter periplasmic adaptor subunit [Gammaproteobacteria bacterium]